MSLQYMYNNNMTALISLFVPDIDREFAVYN